MIRTTTDSEDRMCFKDPADSTSLEEGNSERSRGASASLKKGPWTSAEDKILMDYVKKNGEGNWKLVEKHSGLSRCGKSCRLRWVNHLRPNLKKGTFTAEEGQLIAKLHAEFGNKWASMVAYLPGRTDNEIKNYWNTRIKRHQRAGLPLYPNKEDAENQGMQLNNYNVPDAVFQHFKSNKGPSTYAPTLPDISVGHNLTQGPSASQSSSFMPLTMNHPKRLRTSETFLPNFSCASMSGLSEFKPLHKGAFEHLNNPSPSSFPYGPDPRGKIPSPIGAMPGSYAFLNGNRPASTTLTEPLKLELPSTSLTRPLKSELPLFKWQEYVGHISSFGRSAAQGCNGTTLASGGSSSDEQTDPKTFPGSYVKPKLSETNFLLGLELPECVKDGSKASDDLSTFL